MEEHNVGVIHAIDSDTYVGDVDDVEEDLGKYNNIAIIYGAAVHQPFLVEFFWYERHR